MQKSDYKNEELKLKLIVISIRKIRFGSVERR